jgi:hypothetical protein
MLDIETLGLQPGSAVIAIGAVVFYSDGWIDLTGELAREDAALSYFYAEINAASCQRAGMLLDPKTLRWWSEQPDYAKGLIRRVYDEPGGAVMEEALSVFTRFIHRHSEPCVWGNGSDFDNVLVAAAYAAIGLPPPWSHRNNRCYRTLKALRPDILLAETPGTLHNAYFDALDEARHAQQLLYAIGGV